MPPPLSVKVLITRVARNHHQFSSGRHDCVMLSMGHPNPSMAIQFQNRSEPTALACMNSNTPARLPAKTTSSAATPPPASAAVKRSDSDRTRLYATPATPSAASAGTSAIARLYATADVTPASWASVPIVQ